MQRDFNKKITIQKPVETQGTAGGVVVMWEDFMTNIWASINPISGREYFAAKSAQAETTHHIDFWYIPGITSEMRVKYGNKIFEIESVLNVKEQNRVINLLCVDKGEMVE